MLKIVGLFPLHKCTDFSSECTPIIFREIVGIFQKNVQNCWKSSACSLCTNAQIFRLNAHLFFLGKLWAYFAENYRIVKNKKTKTDDTLMILQNCEKSSAFLLCSNAQICRLNAHRQLLGKSSAYFKKTFRIVKNRRLFPFAQMHRFFVRMHTYPF